MTTDLKNFWSLKIKSHYKDKNSEMNSGKTSSFKFNSQRVFEADSQVTLNTYLNIYEQDLLGKAAHLP